MSTATLPRVRPVTMPKWGIEMQEGTVTAWHFDPGQHVERGQTLLDVETEKIVNSVESPASGTLRLILAGIGETYSVGALIAVLADPEASDAEVEAFARSFKPADTSFEPTAAVSCGSSADSSPRDAPAPPVGDRTTDPGEAHVSPIARRIAERLGVDLSKVVGTGRNGRISKEDVEAYAARIAAQRPRVPATAPTETQEPAARERLTSMRATIARRLAESKRDIPHYRLVADLDMTTLALKRAGMVAAGRRVSLNDLLLHAVAQALLRHPRLNAQFIDDELLQFASVDLALAVATPGGLVTPIVRRADSLPIEELALAARDLAERARAGKLTREEITGGTFTVSNLGMFGVRQFDAIINPPQVAILAVGALEERPVVRDGSLAIGQRLTVTLSSDHRVVDGAAAGAFLATLKDMVLATGSAT